MKNKEHISKFFSGSVYQAGADELPNESIGKGIKRNKFLTLKRAILTGVVIFGFNAVNLEKNDSLFSDLSESIFESIVSINGTPEDIEKVVNVLKEKPSQHAMIKSETLSKSGVFSKSGTLSKSVFVSKGNLFSKDKDKKVSELSRIIENVRLTNLKEYKPFMIEKITGEMLERNIRVNPAKIKHAIDLYVELVNKCMDLLKSGNMKASFGCTVNTYIDKPSGFVFRQDVFSPTNLTSSDKGVVFNFSKDLTEMEMVEMKEIPVEVEETDDYAYMNNVHGR